MKRHWKHAGLFMGVLLVIASGTGCAAQENDPPSVPFRGAADSGLEQEKKDPQETRPESSGESTEEGEQPEKLRKGKALRKGDCIGITAPASSVEGHDFNQAVTFLKNCGFEVKIMDSCYVDSGPFAGEDRQRAEDLNALFADDNVDAILCLRGGYGCARILDDLDYEMIREHPKLLIGYSDITALHIALMQKSGLATVHGPVAASFNSVYSDYIAEKFRNGISFFLSGGYFSVPSEWSYSGYYTMEQFLRGISTDQPLGEIELPEGQQLRTVVPGTARGRVIGGNLTVITSLVGTEYELKGDHAILFFEEVSEKAYRIDRMLRQLYQNGLLDRVDGILIGDMSMNEDEAGLTCSEVIEEYAALAGKPCIAGVPAGHGTDNMFLPFGVEVVMTAKEDGTASLKIVESALEKAEIPKNAPGEEKTQKETPETGEMLTEEPETGEMLTEEPETGEMLTEEPETGEIRTEEPETEETSAEEPENGETLTALPENEEIFTAESGEAGIPEEIPDENGIPSPLILFSNSKDSPVNKQPAPDSNDLPRDQTKQ